MAYTSQERESIYSMISDMHKDAYGFRPHGQWEEIQNKSDSELDAFVADLQSDLNLEIAREQAAFEQARVEFEAHIQNLIETGAGDRATAIRWDMEAEKCKNDVDQYCWVKGLSYTMESEIQQDLGVIVS